MDHAGERLDRVGSVAGTLCAVHCALTALLPAALAALGVGFLASHEVELGLTLVAVVVGTAALWQSWRARRSRGVAALFVAGLLGLLAARWLEAGAHAHDGHAHAREETHQTTGEKRDAHPTMPAVLGIVAGLALAGAHVGNLRASRGRVSPRDA